MGAFKDIITDAGNWAKAIGFVITTACVYVFGKKRGKAEIKKIDTEIELASAEIEETEFKLKVQKKKYELEIEKENIALRKQLAEIQETLDTLQFQFTEALAKQESLEAKVTQYETILHGLNKLKK